MTKNQLRMLFFCALLFAYALGFFDIQVSQSFFDGQEFLFQNNGIILKLEKWLPWVLVIISLGWFFLWLFGKIFGKVSVSTQKMAFVCLSMVLAPGVIVNLIFKTFWGRARPIDLQHFGGDKEFSMPFEIANQCDFDCSFVSGHTSVAFWMLSLVLVSNIKRKKPLFLATFLFASFIALMRVAQGKHFLSDVVAGAVITVMVICWCYNKFLLKGLSKANQDLLQK